jgi:hypothetical protein
MHKSPMRTEFTVIVRVKDGHEMPLLMSSSALRTSTTSSDCSLIVGTVMEMDVVGDADRNAIQILSAIPWEEVSCSAF